MATVQPNNTLRHKPAPSSHHNFHLRDFLYLCAAHWPWFVASVAVCLVCAFIYLKCTAPTYTKEATIIIKTDSDGNSAAANAVMFEDLGLSRGNSSVEDECAIIKSPDIMREVVRALNLDISYKSEGKFRNIDLYDKTLPVQVILPDLQDRHSVSFHLNIQPNGDYTVTDMRVNNVRFDDRTISGRIGEPIRTPMGNLTVVTTPAFKLKEPKTILVSRSPIKPLAKAMASKLNVTQDKEGYNIVKLEYSDTDPKRAEDVIAATIVAYNNRWMKDKRDLADNSSQFISERIKLLESELGSVDNDISSFKSSNMVPDVDAAASLYMTQANQASSTLRDLRIQDSMVKYIHSYLRNSENYNKLLPTYAGIASQTLSGQIAQYNAKLLERNSIVAQSSASNPLVADLDQQISAMRAALVASVDNEALSLAEQIKSQEGFTGEAYSKIASNPRQAKYLLSVERQQKVKETLYLYLLQKREESELNTASSAYNTRLVSEPDGPDAPVAPQSRNIYLVAFLLGLAIPAGTLYLMESSVHVVRGRKDVEDMKIPFAGELPLYGSQKNLPATIIRNDNPKPVVAVKDNNRNAINEAFRVTRTNIEFMLGKDDKCHVLMLTSANPGSGKTFVTYNLAKSLAIKGKRVMVVDLDMRKASLSKYIGKPSKGISDYLAGRVDNIYEIIHHVKDVPDMDMIPVGTLPPNPTELLFSDLLGSLVEHLRKEYDYVFIDCPPVEVVADSSIIGKFADNTLFVIRAGLFDLSMLQMVDKLYEQGKYPNMSLILNGTVPPKSPYAKRHGTSYSYGYGYGYNED